jgi:hypothetical protein
MNEQAAVPDQNSPDQDSFAMKKTEPERDLFQWTAPNRPFKRRNREFFTTVFLIVFLVSLILFFANQFLPIAVVLALGFLTYVLSSVPPEMVTNKITTYGVHSGTHMSFWDEMGRYWMTKKYGHYILHVETIRFPYRMMLLFTDAEKPEVEKLMDRYLIKESPEPTFIDKAADWLQEKVPLDREEKITKNSSQRAAEQPIPEPPAPSDQQQHVAQQSAEQPPVEQPLAESQPAQ